MQGLLKYVCARFTEASTQGGLATLCLLLHLNLDPGTLREAWRPAARAAGRG